MRRYNEHNWSVATLSLLFALAFASCGDDDTTGDANSRHDYAPVLNEYGIVTNSKKLAEIEKDNGSSYHPLDIFGYDSKGRVITINNGYTVTTLGYTDNQIVFSWQSSMSASSGSLSFSEGLVRSSAKAEVSLLYETEENISHLVKAGSTVYTWDGNRLLTAGKSHYSYTGKTCKGFNPILPYYFCFDTFYHTDDYDSYKFLIATPELMGFRTNELPDKREETNNWTYGNVTDSFQYTLDKEGYIEKCKVIRVREGKNGRGEYISSTDTTTYTLKWK